MGIHWHWPQPNCYSAVPLCVERQAERCAHLGRQETEILLGGLVGDEACANHVTPAPSEDDQSSGHAKRCPKDNARCQAGQTSGPGHSRCQVWAGCVGDIQLSASEIIWRSWAEASTGTEHCSTFCR